MTALQKSEEAIQDRGKRIITSLMVCGTQRQSLFMRSNKKMSWVRNVVIKGHGI